MAAPYLERSAADLLPRRPGFDPTVYIKFVVCTVSLDEVPFPLSVSYIKAAHSDFTYSRRYISLEIDSVVKQYISPYLYTHTHTHTHMVSHPKRRHKYRH
jgi:hypothetical protein